MTAKEIVREVYESDAFINIELMKSYIHPDVCLDWNSSKGPFQMKRNDIENFVIELSKAYQESTIKIHQLLGEDDLVTIRYSHFVRTIENPREELLLANFIVIWELKDHKLFRGYQISQLT
jgi:hypothetical protein